MYDPKNLSVLAYANSFTLWHYVTDDEAITSEGYFNRAIDMLRENDLIIANTDNASSTGFYVVAPPTDDDDVIVTAYI